MSVCLLSVLAQTSACSSDSASQRARAIAAPQVAGSSGALPNLAAAPTKGSALSVQRAGQELAVTRVFSQRLPYSDAVTFTLVDRAAVDCSSLPRAGEAGFVASMLVSRYLSAERGEPSRRPLRVKFFKVGNQQVDGPFDWLEPFIEPTTATLMFGQVDAADATLAIRGQIQAEVCLPPTPNGKDNVASSFLLSYLGARLRVRGATIKNGVLRLSTSPLTCSDELQGDFELRLQGQSVSIDGWASPRSSDFRGKAEVSRRGSEHVLSVEGTLLGPLELEGTVTPRPC